MNLYEYLELTKNDFDTCDNDFDAIVTVCHIGKENDNYDKFCNELMKKVEMLSKNDDYLTVSWSVLIRGNMDKFRAFTKEHWSFQYEDDDDEFVYQWIKEFHSYLAGMVSDSFYGTLVEFIETLTPSIAKNYVVCISDSYLRDTQVFNPIQEAFDEQNEDNKDYIEELTDDDNNWYDYTGSAFLGIYKWNEATLDGLRQYVATCRGLNPATLEIIPVE